MGDAQVDRVRAALRLQHLHLRAQSVIVPLRQDGGPHLAARVPHETVRRVVGDQPALAHDGQMGRHVLDVGHDMGRHDHQLAEADFRQQVAEAQPLLRIEAGGRLVDDQHIGIVEQRLRDAEPAPHAARESGRLPVRVLVQVDRLQQVPQARRIAHALQRREVLQEFQRGQVRIDAEILRQEAEAPAYRIGLAHDVGTVEQYLAAGRPGQRGDHLHQRRLAGAVMADQADHAGGQLQTDVVDRTDVVRIGFHDTA